METPKANVLDMIRQVIAPDLRAALSEDDLRKRLAFKGYGLHVTERGRILTTLPHGVEVGPLH